MIELIATAESSIIGVFLSFFLVTINQTNDRFFDVCGFAKAVADKVQNVAGLVSAKLPTE